MHNNSAPVVSDHGDIAAGFAAADQVFAQRYDTGFVHNAQLEPRCALAHWQGDTLTCIPPPKALPIAAMTWPGIWSWKTIKCASCATIWAVDRQQESKPGRRPDRRHALPTHQGAGHAGIHAPRRLARHAWALAHRATVQGGGQKRWHRHRHPAHRLQWHGPLSQECRGHQWPGAVCLPQSISFDLAGVYQSHHLGQFPGAV